MNKYKRDRQWSDPFIPEIKRIIGPYLLDIASLEVDCNQAADLIVLNAQPISIACRIRRPGFASNYGDQFTLRCHRDNGAKTELEKIVEGFGTWMFYGHSSVDERSICRWMLIDLKAFRAHLIRERCHLGEGLANRSGGIRSGIKSNGDGTHFAWFDARSFLGTPPLLVANSETALFQEVA